MLLLARLPRAAGQGLLRPTRFFRLVDCSRPGCGECRPCCGLSAAAAADGADDTRPQPQENVRCETVAGCWLCCGTGPPQGLLLHGDRDLGTWLLLHVPVEPILIARDLLWPPMWLGERCPARPITAASAPIAATSSASDTPPSLSPVIPVVCHLTCAAADEATGAD